MKLKTSKPSDGVAWMVAGLRTFRSQALNFTSLMGLVMFLMGLLLVIPGLGPLVMLAALPGLSAGWVACGRSAQRGESANARVLISAFTGPARKSILVLGALFAAIAWLLLAGIDLWDPAFREQWALAMSSEGSEDARGEALVAAQQGMLLRAVSLLPLALVFWHAPVLAHEESMPPAKALFGSLLTVKRHFTTFVVYGLAWLAADVAMSLALGLVLGVLGAGQWAILVAMPVSLVFCAAFYASLHATVDGCMQMDSPNGPSSAAADHP